MSPSEGLNLGKRKPSQEKKLIPEISELEKPVKVILEKIRPRIERHEYGLIIGDDASGRIPALIFTKFFKEVSETTGVQAPQTIFLAGSMDLGFKVDKMSKRKVKTITKLRNKEFLEYLKTIPNFDATKRVLVVTDVVQSGTSLSPIIFLLRGAGLEYDIATMSLAPTKFEGELDDNLFGSTIISGEYARKFGIKNSYTPKIYAEYELLGVIKSFGQAISKPYIDNEFSEESRIEASDSIARARQDVAVLGSKLAQWYLSKK